MAVELDVESIVERLPDRPSDGHKGTFGHLVVVAGSRGFTGAAKLAALAAARGGVGLVTLAVPETVWDVVASGLWEVMTRGLPATKGHSIASSGVADAMTLVEGKDAVALGPGLGQHPDTQRFVVEFARACPVPLVIDADGLNALANDTATIRAMTSPPILTPHPGEMARLTGNTTKAIAKDREGFALDFAKRHHCTVVLKGARTIVAHHDGRSYENPTGNSGMGTGGTGDVLTGLIGAMLAQGLGPIDAAIVGAFVHGLAGDIAAHLKTERALVATDVIDSITGAWHALEG